MLGIINELCALFKSTRSTTVLWVTKKLIWIHAFRFRDAISDNVYLPPAYTTCCKDSLSPWLADNLVSMYHLVLFLLNLCHTLTIHWWFMSWTLAIDVWFMSWALAIDVYDTAVCTIVLLLFNHFFIKKSILFNHLTSFGHDIHAVPCHLNYTFMSIHIK